MVNFLMSHSPVRGVKFPNLNEKPMSLFLLNYYKIGQIQVQFTHLTFTSQSIN